MDMTENFEKTIGYHFRNSHLLTQAMTHSSYANEHGGNRLACNERLEFLGDAVLELVSSEVIYGTHPEMNEGQMTKFRASIVCEPALAEVARTLGIPAMLLLGKGEEAAGGRLRDSLTSDALEALIGAVYLDGGFAPAENFVKRFIMSGLEKRSLFKDSKTILQEKMQEMGLGDPVYEVLSIAGPEHLRVFTVALRAGDGLECSAEGRNKKQAEQLAAAQMLKKLEKQ